MCMCGALQLQGWSCYAVMSFAEGHARCGLIGKDAHSCNLFAKVRGIQCVMQEVGQGKIIILLCFCNHLIGDSPGTPKFEMLEDISGPSVEVCIS